VRVESRPSSTTRLISNFWLIRSACSISISSRFQANKGEPLRSIKTIPETCVLPVTPREKTWSLSALNTTFISVSNNPAPKRIGQIIRQIGLISARSKRSRSRSSSLSWLPSNGLLRPFKTNGEPLILAEKLGSTKTFAWYGRLDINGKERLIASTVWTWALGWSSKTNLPPINWMLFTEKPGVSVGISLGFIHSSSKSEMS